jgi:hypothetical protein
MVRTLTFRGRQWVGDPMLPHASCAREGYSALISVVMSLTDAFASPNSIAVFGS